ncbi:MAG: EAL domain-containing protein [Solobacterium sp.]|nr:EAL domain-containing protein [Solobacterium sp.]
MLKNKRLIKLTVSLFAVLSCLLMMLTVSGEEDKEVLVIGVPADRTPVFYVDEASDEIVGIGVDVMRIAAKNAGYEPVFVDLQEATLKDALDSDAYDVVMPFGSAISSTEGKQSIVSESLIETPFTFVTEKNRNLSQFRNLKVGMLRSQSGVAETVRQRYPGITISTYETMDECVKALRGKKVDALLHNSYVWSYILQKPSYSDLKIQPAAVFSMEFRAGTLDTPKGQEIMERLNQGIGKITDTQRQAIALDYTSRRLYRYDLSDYLYQYKLVLLVFLLLLVSLIAFAMRRQKAASRKREEQIRQLVDIDPLTNMLSMNGFRKRVEELLHTHPDIQYLITYNNVRNFKFINDSLGREAGDDLLRFWGRKLLENLSEEETACRITADHFAILRRIQDEEKIKQDERNIIEPVRNFFIDQGKGTRVQICTGIYVLTPEDYQKIDVDKTLDFARLAEQRLRNTRKDGYEFYNPEEWKRGKQVADVCGRLPVAIREKELQVWYQPQVNYETGEIIGAEALCRWNHDKLGWLRPSEFIPILEEAGLIYDLDCYMWNQVCQDLQRWNQQGQHRTVSVNLSRCDIREELNIPGQFFDLIKAYDLTPDQLRIEITESAFAENPELLIRMTVKLREFGFQVEMDDFGSGYSSLHMLKEVPVDRIKLDLDFLSGAGDPERGRIIISHVVQLVQSLGMNLIAEGVENVSQANFLKSRGCIEMQGFYFYKPMSSSEFEELGEKPSSKNPEPK